MIKRIFCALLILMLVIPSAITVSAVTSYGLYVGGVQVTDENAADVLGDGTVSYDAATNTLTLNGANITAVHTTDMFISGIYTEIANLTVDLVGENRITIPIKDDDMPDGSEVAVVSTKSMKISGTGKLWSNSYVVFGAQDVVIKNCEISSDWICIGAMGNVTVEDATVSGKVGLINTMTGDITLKNTNVPDGGNYVGIYTETGDITIENSNVTIHCATVGGEATVPIAVGEGGGSFTVKNSVLDIKGNMYGILAPTSAAVFENVSGKIEAAGDAAYAMIFGGAVSIKGCDLEISCRATEDAACGICTEYAIGIEDSKLKIDTRTADEAALCIGNLESPNTNVDVWNSTLVLTASGPNAAGFYANNVKLNDSITKVEATALATGKGFAAGIAAVQGCARVNGGVLEVLATGPMEHEGPATVGILMGNPVLVPEFIGADVKLRGNQALAVLPDLSIYGREYELTASTEITGAAQVELNSDTLASIRYLHIHPFYKISFSGNGLTGTMADVTDVYGSFTLPENGFTLPERTVFKGWSLSADGEILTETSIVPHADTVLYAIWEELPPEPVHVHSFGEDWKSDAKTHYKECECGEKTLVSAHVDKNENGSCDICLAVCEDEGIGAGVIALIVIGSIAVLGGGGFCVYWFIIKKKRA